LIFNREDTKQKHQFYRVGDTLKVMFFLCVLYQRSNFFETRQMGKVVQHRENILNPSPDYLRGVASHKTQIETPISN
jgi:hypothetical protein